MAQRPLRFLTPLALGAAILGWMVPPQGKHIPLLAEPIHLGDDQTPEWPEASPAPVALDTFGGFFELDADQLATLQAEAPAALRLWTRHVDGEWVLSINGKGVGTLPRGAERLEHLLAIPSAALKVGHNTFRLEGHSQGDDITVGPMELLPQSFRETLQLIPLALQVVDAEGHGIPARLSFSSGQGLVPLYDPDGRFLAVRPGVAYTDNEGKAEVELAAGQSLRITASHGPEWNIASTELELPPGRDQDLPPVVLQLEKQVATDGWLAVDTHLHTLTFSGHGDASVEERMRTLAGEGLDVAIATDHNHQTDYRPWQEAQGFASVYRSLIGNEVTTDLGHFNAFPFAADAPIPDPSLTTWQGLADEMHAKGAQTIILNHPRWPDRERGPYGVSALDPRSGRFGDGLRLPVDAMEVFNSTTPEVPWQELRRDWFSLLNAGTKVCGVGSSDSHTVYDPVGQGRTWIQATSDDPLQVSPEAIASAIREGRSSMGLGLFATVTVEGEGPGELLTVPEDRSLSVRLEAPLPDWAGITKVEIFVDGILVADNAFPAGQIQGGGLRRFAFEIPAPAHDAWLVAAITGPRPQGAWWSCAFADTAWMSNPIWLDGDGDGQYRSPAATAELLLDGLELDAQGLPQPAALAHVLKEIDGAVAVQLLLAAQDRWGEQDPRRLGMIPALAPPALRPPLEDLLQHP